MNHSRVLLIFLFFFSSFAQGANPQQAFIEQFASSRIQMPPEDSPWLDNPGRYPKPLNFLFEYVFSWTPTGERKNFNASCDSELWKERLLDPRLKGAMQLQGALIQKYFQDCREELETGRNSNWANATKMMSMNYDPQAHPFLRKVLINLPGNIKLTAVLGLKGDLKRRPFVVIRTGIFSSVEDFRPERAWLMMLFEQAPFNVLLVENMTSSDFVANNSQLSLGGYDEGIQNLLIAKLLKDPKEPLAQLVESVHLFGISLGGHGVLFSSLLNKYNSSPKKPLIQSFTTLCPVVDLQATMKNLTSKGIMSSVADVWGRQRLAGLTEKLPAVKDHKAFGFMDKAVSEIARTYTGGLSYISKVQLPPGMKDGSQFWELNNFWPYYEDVAQPVLIYATQNDPLVPFDINSQRLQNKSLKINSKNIHVIDLPQGVHCTLAVPYDWSTLTTLFSTFMMSHSSGFKLNERHLDFELSEPEWAAFFDGQGKAHVKSESLNVDARYAPLTISLVSSGGEKNSLKVSLPLSDFDFRFYNSELSDSEQQMLTRWMNQNLRAQLLMEKGKPVLRLKWSVAH